MSPEERGARATLARLRGSLAVDRQRLTLCEEDAELARSRLAKGEADQATLALAGVALHGWYTGLEAIFERTARDLDRTMPTGPHFHRELLMQASVEVPGTRPAIVDADAVDDLTELLAFRHFFRHGYGLRFEVARIEAMLERLARVATPVRESLDAFGAFLA